MFRLVRISFRSLPLQTMFYATPLQRRYYDLVPSVGTACETEGAPMTCRTIAVANQKGGTAKTATALSL